MSVGAFCNREVVVTGPETGIVELAKLMRQFHVGDVVVVEESNGLRKPVGIVTDRDLVVEVIAGEVDFAPLRARDVMGGHLLVAREKDSIWETMKLMAAQGIRRVPVVDAHGTLAGILSLDDLLELLAEELSMLAGVAGRGREREADGGV